MAWPVLLLTAGCGGALAASDPSGSSQPGNPPQTLTVFAAASLKDTFPILGRTFEATHPGTTVRFSFAGSADLVSQLQQGAPADVFASADATNMAKATGDDLVAGAPVEFASNTLVIAVPPENPAKITSFRDLARPGVRLVVCAPLVPCGAATHKVEATTGVHLSAVSEENAVTDVLSKVRTGEADAGLVYTTDVHAAAGQVKGILIPEARAAVNVYPIAVLSASTRPDLARQFVELVTGAEGQRVLADAGFGRP